MSDYQTDWLDEVEGRLQAATPGPWEPRGLAYSTTVGRTGDFRNIARMGDPLDGEAWRNAEFIAHAPEDIARLISEVHRYRDEESSHVAARYWRTIQTQRRMIENQAVTIERHDATLKHVELAVHGSLLAGTETVNAGLLRDILSGQA